MDGGGGYGAGALTAVDDAGDGGIVVVRSLLAWGSDIPRAEAVTAEEGHGCLEVVCSEGVVSRRELEVVRIEVPRAEGVAAEESDCVPGVQRGSGLEGLRELGVLRIEVPRVEDR